MRLLGIDPTNEQASLRAALSQREAAPRACTLQQPACGPERRPGIPGPARGPPVIHSGTGKHTGQKVAREWSRDGPETGRVRCGRPAGGRPSAPGRQRRPACESVGRRTGDRSARYDRNAAAGRGCYVKYGRRDVIATGGRGFNCRVETPELTALRLIAGRNVKKEGAEISGRPKSMPHLL